MMRKRKSCARIPIDEDTLRKQLRHLSTLGLEQLVQFEVPVEKVVQQYVSSKYSIRTLSLQGGRPPLA